jgi:molybdate transport system substrate-binding protein
MFQRKPNCRANALLRDRGRLMSSTVHAKWPVLTAAALLSIVTSGIANAGEIKLLAGSAVETTMSELIPAFERASGHKVAHDFNGAIGQMTERVLNGEAADVVIVSAAQIDALSEAGKVKPGSRIDIAKVAIGVFVRKGAPKPDISSVAAFKRAMLAARSIGWNDPRGWRARQSPHDRCPAATWHRG